MDHFSSFDGVRIAFHDSGAGRPALMLHGFLANGQNNFVNPGIAGAAQAAGFRTIIPDLRGHGESDMPEEPAAYPVDVLAMDQEALLQHLGNKDYVLIGYSLGARTAVRMLARGAKPARAVIAGMGDSGITDAKGRSADFEDLIRNGASSANPALAQTVAGMMKRWNLKRQAMLNILEQQASTSPAALKQIMVPALVVSGRDDDDNGSAEGLAQLLGNATAQRTPGNHLSAVQTPELARAIVDFIAAG